MVKICSFNVKGLGNKEKRRIIFQWLKDKKVDICFIQEAHYTNECKVVWGKDWGGEMYFSGNDSRSMGVGIMFNPSFNMNVINSTEIVEGRALALNININEKQLTLVNVYGPNKDDVTFFEKIETFCNSNENILLGGDFNVVIDPNIDKSGGNKNTHPRCRAKLKKIMDDFELIDVWRTFNQDKKVYTWHSNTRPKIFCRLDFFLLQNHMMNTVVNVEIKNSIKSDHSVVLINIEINNIKRGPGIFKLNNSMLLDIAYKEKVQKAIKDIKDHNNDADPIVLWSLIKGAIRNETISFSSRKQKVEEEKLKKLEQEISNLEQEIEQANNNNNNNNNSNNNKQ